MSAQHPICELLVFPGDPGLSLHALGDLISARAPSAQLNPNLSLALLQHEGEQGSADQSAHGPVLARLRGWAVQGAWEGAGEAETGAPSISRSHRQWRCSLSVMNKEARSEGRKPRSCGSEVVSF